MEVGRVEVGTGMYASQPFRYIDLPFHLSLTFLTYFLTCARARSHLFV